MLFTLLLGLRVLATCPTTTTRKEVNDMTPGDWDVYTSTILAAKNKIDPVSGISVWETAAKFHNDNSKDIHWSCVFFFWHRYDFLLLPRVLVRLLAYFSRAAKLYHWLNFFKSAGKRLFLGHKPLSLQYSDSRFTLF